VGAGLSNKDIARRLHISLGTTKSHVHNLLGKLSLQRRAEIMARMRGQPMAIPSPEKNLGSCASGPNEIHPSN
jgi:FixJ family two-component response regulator